MAQDKMPTTADIATQITDIEGEHDYAERSIDGNEGITVSYTETTITLNVDPYGIGDDHVTVDSRTLTLLQDFHVTKIDSQGSWTGITFTRDE